MRELSTYKSLLMEAGGTIFGVKSTRTRIAGQNRNSSAKIDQGSQCTQRYCCPLRELI
ncbi:MAG: hypothetical protein ACRD5E_08440 [Nitrososphaeraceae archaeon]